MLDRGARVAEPGEFTRRAFLNGRIDLAQAEAVQRVIHARDETELRMALRALGGRLSSEAERLRVRILELCAEVEAGLDFSDQDIEIIAARDVAEQALALAAEARAAANAAGGRLGTEAPRVALCGPVNVGKSSLFNAFVTTDRAITAPHPGTTRDTIEAEVEWDGLRLCLVDTAGRRSPADAVEAEAIERAHRAGAEADLVLLVLDATGPDESMRHAAEEISPERLIVVRNKCDLVESPARDATGGLVPAVAEAATSVLTGAGLNVLRRLILARLRTAVERSASGLALNARHADALTRAAAALERAADAAKADALDLAAADLREALDAIGEISGHVLPDQILDRVFSTFCIGK
jgi:tRNA modification GTPase